MRIGGALSGSHLDEFAELMTRRLEAERVLRVWNGPSNPWHRSTHDATSRALVDTEPELQRYEGCYVNLWLNGPLDRMTTDLVRPLVTHSLGAVLHVPVSAYAHPRTMPNEQFRGDLEAVGLFPDFVGSHQSGADRRLVALFSHVGSTPPTPPATFRVVAMITAFNEQDVIADVIQHLIRQGVDVILIDNWSTDATVERASKFLGEGLVRIETFPPSGPSPSFDLGAVLRFESEVAMSEPADWFIHHDADEIRRSPWPAMTLKQAIYRADVCGFNAIDHTELDFHPTDDTFEVGARLEDHFRYFSPAPVVASNYRVNAWKNLGLRVDLVTAGGHSVLFEGRKVFPYNFLLKHYPIRSQSHGEQKVLRERKPRWNAEERRRGWHFHYDHVRVGHVFVRSPEELSPFGESTLETMLLERLSAVGLHSAPARYSWKSRDYAIGLLRRLRVLGVALRVQKWLRVALRRDVSLGRR